MGEFNLEEYCEEVNCSSYDYMKDAENIEDKEIRKDIIKNIKKHCSKYEAKHLYDWLKENNYNITKFNENKLIKVEKIQREMLRKYEGEWT